MSKQVVNGNGYEYAIAQAFSRVLNCGVVWDDAEKNALKAYQAMESDDRRRVDISAAKVVAFLIRRDKRVNHAEKIRIQGSKLGKLGDVRDIVIDCSNAEIGISAKHQHDAVKHSRLSSTIDFGKEWGNCPVSPAYWQSIKPIFDDLRERQTRGELWRDMPGKIERVYVPVLNAFQHELVRLCDNFGKEFVPKFFTYLIGHQDFYKVICYNQDSVIESVNINGTLAWGEKWKIPDRIQSVEWKRNSKTTLIVTFDGGWSVSFRIHNASSRIEPSLKFDIGFQGFSKKVSKAHLLHYDD